MGEVGLTLCEMGGECHVLCKVQLSLRQMSLRNVISHWRNVISHWRNVIRPVIHHSANVISHWCNT